MEQLAEFDLIRAQKYNNLIWATDKLYLEAIVQAAEPNKTDTVLDVGTGTGLVANAIAPYVDKVIGLDISKQMLEINPYESIRADARDMITEKGQLSECQFDKVIARMVFHHLTKGMIGAARQCYRVLKPGGLFVLSEGTPPNLDSTKWYAQMFSIKEKRVVFLPEDLQSLLQSAGFVNIKTYYHRIPQVSIRNWIENSGMDNEHKAKMWKVQMQMPDNVWRAYNTTVTSNGDILKDFRFCTVVGQKP